MAITLNKYAARCEKIALAEGRITDQSSARPLMYDISRSWRDLLDATSFMSLRLGKWSEKEEAASEIILSSIAYLKRIGCADIEQLIKDTIDYHERSG